MKRLYKSGNDTIFCGICGGIAEYFSVDSTLVRIAAVFFAVITGFFMFAFGYLIACLIIPNKSGKSLINKIKEEVIDEKD